MPANIPSPIVGAGGGNDGPQWWEQLLLTLASQGPSTLMQWMEHRQASQQAQAIDAADQFALQSFAGTANPMEQGAISAAGGSPGIAAAGGAVSPSGIKAPIVKPMTAGNQPNMQGMRRGVAGPLLDRLSQLRTNQEQRDASAASVRASNANTAGALGQENRAATAFPIEQARAAELFPLEKDRIIAATESSKAATATAGIQGAESKARTRQIDQQVSYDDAIQDYRVRIAAAQALGSEAETRKVEQDISTRINDRVVADLERVGEFATKLMASDPQLMASGIGEARRLASLMITGVPNATAADLHTLYRQLADDPNANLDAILKARVIGSLGLADDEAVTLDGILASNAGDPQKAIETMDKAGASVDQLSQMQGYFYALTGQMAVLPKQNSMLARRLRNAAQVREQMERAAAGPINLGAPRTEQTIEGRGPIKREPGAGQGAVSATFGVPQPIR